jgi:hypothetical protein
MGGGAPESKRLARQMSGEGPAISTLPRYPLRTDLQSKCPTPSALTSPTGPGRWRIRMNGGGFTDHSQTCPDLYRHPPSDLSRRAFGTVARLEPGGHSSSHTFCPVLASGQLASHLLDEN